MKTLSTILLVLFVLCFGAQADTCIQECQKRYRDRIRICDDLFQSPGSAYYQNTSWHKDCLDQAKTEFDNCRSTCK